ncbi:hypothetical protein [Spongiimicrobium sp. 2-473A-2-J]|uniref:hypothetical protein n=1 Tax=Eudoraea algarum TaxID=3417568 RepID=UPI003D3601F4
MIHISLLCDFLNVQVLICIFSKTFGSVHENGRLDEANVLEAYQVSELLVILRLQELFKDTYTGVSALWSNIPMFVTAHDYDIIYKVQKKD